MKTGVELISVERARQISAEGWTPEHDDSHDGSELSLAAESYLNELNTRSQFQVMDVNPPESWPWEEEWWKPTENEIRQLTKAGALLSAEIDRLTRIIVRRAKNPQEGDKFSKDWNLVEVKYHADGNVGYDVRIGGDAPEFRTISIDEWHKLAQSTLDSGAEFIPAKP